jgi:hypothetical protein
MTIVLKPGQGLLYMKVGTHAQESLEVIIARKTREIEQAGFALWGYGGNTCHPQTMVQPFVRSFEQLGQIIYLCMQPMESSHFAEPIRAEEYSVDGVAWQPIPPAINVLGSRYALAIRQLRKEEFDLPLAKTRVALGNSMGSNGDRYIAGRVDKACLEITEEIVTPVVVEPRVRIGLVAEIVKPYAVYVRNAPPKAKEHE